MFPKGKASKTAAALMLYGSPQCEVSWGKNQRWKLAAYCIFSEVCESDSANTRGISRECRIGAGLGACSSQWCFCGSQFHVCSGQLDTDIFQRTNMEPETGLQFSGVKLLRRRPSYSKQVQCLYVPQFLLDEVFVMFTARLR